MFVASLLCHKPFTHQGGQGLNLAYATPHTPLPPPPPSHKLLNPFMSACHTSLSVCTSFFRCLSRLIISNVVCVCVFISFRHQDNSSSFSLNLSPSQSSPPSFSLPPVLSRAPVTPSFYLRISRICYYYYLCFLHHSLT